MGISCVWSVQSVVCALSVQWMMGNVVFGWYVTVCVVWKSMWWRSDLWWWVNRSSWPGFVTVRCSVSAAPQGYVYYVYLCFDLNENSVSVCCGWHRTAYKKYSRSFVKLQLNHWWQMDYFGNVFHTFLGLDSVNCLAVNGTVISLPVFIQNNLNCVPKTNKAFTGLERHGVSY